MVQVLSSGQGLDEVVAVSTVVGGALDLGEVGHLVQDGGLLVLGVAGGAGGREGGEEERAVDHDAGGGLGVGQDAVAARAEHVVAVVARRARGGAAALADDAAEDGGDGAARRRRRRLEVLLELAGRARRRGRLRALRQAAAGADGVARGRALRARAGRLHDGALDLLVEGVVHPLGRRAVDRGRDDVADEGHDAGDGRRVALGEGEGALAQKLDGTALAEVVSLGSIELNLNGLAGGDALEGLLGQALGGNLVADAIEGDLLVYIGPC